jgi:hypothetical protein
MIARHPDHGVDARPESRPGVPMEYLPPHAAEHAPALAAQRGSGARVFVDPTRAGLTPVYGATQPPRALSGWIRRAAYRFPDYKVKRWLLLLLAERVDVQERRLGRWARSPIAWAAAFGVAAAAVARRRR